MTRGPADAVFLLTDYGYEDEFAGVTRAVVLREAPGATVVDLSHGVPPFDVRAGALMLSRSVVHLGPGVVVAVVDPGVGSGRRAVAVAVGDAAGAGAGEADTPRPSDGPRYLVGPDNGLLGWAIGALGGARAAVALPAAVVPEGSGGSFDGRDLFAPVAARLWRGASLHDVGLPVETASLVELADPAVGVEAGTIEAEVLWVDRFGNVELAAGATEAAHAGLMDETPEIEIETEGSPRRGRRVESFAALGGLDEDEVGLVLDSNGRLALVCNRRAAATVLAVRAGEMVRLRAVSS